MSGKDTEVPISSEIKEFDKKAILSIKLTGQDYYRLLKILDREEKHREKSRENMRKKKNIVDERGPAISSIKILDVRVCSISE